jgi:predicted nucleic acid-binding protein
VSSGLQGYQRPTFLDLAFSGKAELLVSGDNDLLALTGQTTFLIETPEAYRLRIEGKAR